MKELIKKALKSLPFDFTLNQRYDRLTRKVIRKVCRPDSHCVDVGCHKGEILDLLLAAAPLGVHYGFEPVPDLFDKLKQKYNSDHRCRILDIALSDSKGSASFNYVVSNPSYSGLQKRNYDRSDEQDTLITVQTERLDDVLPDNFRVDFIKIDVEGGELLVMKGATGIMKKYRPVIIFEHGLGASDIYGSTPEQVFDLLQECGLSVSLLDRFLQGKSPLDRTAFSGQYHNRENYYFIAYP
ncbi:MAG: hypothetical protein RJA20_1174 [Bacteroidota bacterium]